jgi:hypothetical protein
LEQLLDFFIHAVPKARHTGTLMKGLAKAGKLGTFNAVPEARQTREPDERAGTPQS